MEEGTTECSLARRLWSADMTVCGGGSRGEGATRRNTNVRRRQRAGTWARAQEAFPPAGSFPGDREGLPRRLRGKETACRAGDTGLIPRSGGSPGEGNGNPLQYSCLENPMATIYGVTRIRHDLTTKPPPPPPYSHTREIAAVGPHVLNNENLRYWHDQMLTMI